MATATKKAPRRLARPTWAKEALEAGLLPDGTVLLDVVIPERAVPWKAATTTRHGVSFKDARLVAWQETVKLWGLLNRTIARPYGGPVEVRVWASFSGGHLPDAVNILKAAEDALQEVVYVNDRQVVRNSSMRSMHYGDEDSMRIVVRAVDPDGEDRS